MGGFSGGFGKVTSGLYQRTKKHNENIAKALKNHPCYKNKERSLNISKSKKGSIPWNKNKKGLQIAWNKGLTKEDERVNKYASSLKNNYRTNTKILCGFKKGYKPYNKGKPQTKKWLEMRKKLVLPKKDSSIEVKIQNFLKQLGIEFFTHQYMKIEHGYQCDILIPSLNLVIECDGDYWHNYPDGREIDDIRTKELIKNGFKVLRLWEFEIRAMNINDFKEKLL